MQANHVIGVLISVLMTFMVLLGMGVYYFARAMQRRLFQARNFGQSSTGETQGTRSIFSSQASSEQLNQEFQSSSSTQSRSTRASARRDDSKHPTYQAKSERSRRLSDIAEEWQNGGYQGVSPEGTSDETAESLLQLEQEIPVSHGCNQTCHGHHPRPGERQVGLGIAHGKGRQVFADNE
ncbi:783e94ef-df90-4010-add9-0c51eb720162 [Sclerotinia trifoliorum]|uniref:783e94ef-df90-4010-add9-0c51eb720162 n=1 Tax=Sclerotinia trifoliorum TaxID=28548 RepID=A0A8H2VL18_9HELO|nr:783e94ef-df90-4010-add9-0c51eb720162 [Sclerotinia trifoliorum]